MDITIHSSFLPHNDPDASPAFHRDILGFEVRTDVGYGGMRWITVGPADQPGTSIVLQPPAADPASPTTSAGSGNGGRSWAPSGCGWQRSTDSRGGVSGPRWAGRPGRLPRHRRGTRPDR